MATLPTVGVGLFCICEGRLWAQAGQGGKWRMWPGRACVLTLPPQQSLTTRTALASASRSASREAGYAGRMCWRDVVEVEVWGGHRQREDFGRIVRSECAGSTWATASPLQWTVHSNRTVLAMHLHLFRHEFFQLRIRFLSSIVIRSESCQRFEVMPTGMPEGLRGNGSTHW
ncbi:hypothetical protein EI77_00103 [Prosthecobacter fusiformis]|uniref:Uncharacterized protein n=1 Tax=Prosthecobacter fusiformis TaxID=48464 RepID=A0A4R7SQW6_9BACT|nr:hypothetical protein EI77_00103 [Prosthecobacter fusiformis]